MFLRVSEKLMFLLRNDLQQMETTFSESIELNVNFKKLVDFLFSINIRKPYYLKDKTLTIRDLSGREFIKVFEKIDISIFNLDKVGKKKTTWAHFYELIFKIKDDDLTSTELKTRANFWLDNYIDTVIDTSDSVTPYMHIFVSHLHQHIRYLDTKGLSINSFSMQGLEKQNDFTTTYFQRGTNKKGDIIQQIFTKRTRIEILTTLSDNQLFQLLNRPKTIQSANESIDESEEES